MALAKGNVRELRISRPVIKQFLLCFFSFEMLLLANLYGTAAIVGYIAPWLVFTLMRFNAVKRSVIKNWPLLLMPALALFSTLWSREPAWTFKASLELTVTIVIGIVAAQCIRPRVLTASLMIGLLTVAVASVTVGLDYSGGGISGIYSSKNAFSNIVSLLLLIAVSVYGDKGFPFFMRAAAVFSILLAPVLLYLGHSVGTIVSVFLTLMIYAYLRFMARLPVALRLIGGLTVIAMITIIMIAIVMFDFDPMSILGMVGKDSSLTGRTHLWKRAIDFIGERPLQGIGFSAFWRLGNPGAEELWNYAGVPRGAGFNFHNEYLEVLVENGMIGLILLLGYIAIVGKRALRIAFRGPNSKESFALLLFIYLFLRTPLEVGLLGQFGIIVILLCVIWVYTKPALQPKKVLNNHG